MRAEGAVAAMDVQFSEVAAAAVGFGFTTWGREGGETNHASGLNGAIWGFLSDCVSGEAQAMFKQADTDGSGVLSRQQFSTCLRNTELGLSRKEINALMGEADSNHDGVVSYDEVRDRERERDTYLGIRYVMFT